MKALAVTANTVPFTTLTRSNAPVVLGMESVPETRFDAVDVEGGDTPPTAPVGAGVLLPAAPVPGVVVETAFVVVVVAPAVAVDAAVTHSALSNCDVFQPEMEHFAVAVFGQPVRENFVAPHCDFEFEPHVKVQQQDEPLRQLHCTAMSIKLAPLMVGVVHEAGQVD